MRFAGMMPQQSRQNTVAGFFGGLNTQEPPEEISDSQLLSCENFYFDNGELMRRPGFTTLTRNVKIEQSQNSAEIARYSTLNGQYNILKTEKSTYVFRNDGTLMHEWQHPYSQICTAGFFTEQDKDTVLFFGEYSNPSETKITKINLSAIPITHLDGVDAYVPTTFINARPTDTLFDLATGGVPYEGYNMLSAQFKSLWTSDGQGKYYSFPMQIVPPASLTYTDETGTTVVWTIISGSTTSAYNNVKISGVTRSLRLAYNGFNNCLWLEERVGDDDVPVELPESGYSDNVLVSATRSEWSSDTAKEIFNMGFSTWFGGTASGVGDGTRLFVSGNANQPNMVRYSDVNNPLYFPDNNFIFVGQKSQPVTAFGKQNEYLVIFKTHEIYACEYAWSAVSGEDVAAGIVPDVTSDAYFPIRQINGGIGCDCPNTVKLCGNHLVWANKDDKRIYTLSNFSNYTEKNVRDISWVIAPTIKNAITSSASAVVWGDFYILMANTQDIFLFDYTQNGFTYYASYYDDKRASTRIPWYRWKFDIPLDYSTEYYATNTYLMGENGYFMMMALYRVASSTNFYIPYIFMWGEDIKIQYETGGLMDAVEKEITTRIDTKAFNFDLPHMEKTIEGAYLRVSGYGEMSFSWNTDKDEKNNQYVKNISTALPIVIQIPYRVSRVRIVSLCIKTKGNIRIGGIVWKFRALGEVK